MWQTEKRRTPWCRDQTKVTTDLRSLRKFRILELRVKEQGECRREAGTSLTNECQMSSEFYVAAFESNARSDDAAILGLQRKEKVTKRQERSGPRVIQENRSTRVFYSPSYSKKLRES